jgi:hypothetical protein
MLSESALNKTWGRQKNGIMACRSEENANGFFDSETENNNALTVEICGVLSARLF